MFHIYRENGITAFTKPTLIEGKFYMNIIYCKLMDASGNIVYQTSCWPCRNPTDAVDAAMKNYKRMRS